jgi:hypothetical protein
MMYQETCVTRIKKGGIGEEAGIQRNDWLLCLEHSEPWRRGGNRNINDGGLLLHLDYWTVRDAAKKGARPITFLVARKWNNYGSGTPAPDLASGDVPLALGSLGLSAGRNTVKPKLLPAANDPTTDYEAEMKPRLFCTIFACEGPESHLQVGFVVVPDRQSTFCSVRHEIERSQPFLENFAWEFVHPFLGPLSSVQELEMCPLFLEENPTEVGNAEQPIKLFIRMKRDG